MAHLHPRTPPTTACGSGPQTLFAPMPVEDGRISTPPVSIATAEQSPQNEPMHRDRTPDIATSTYYETHASAYATETAALSMATQIARFTTLLPPGAQVVDVGCGAGRDLRRFRELKYQPVGLDFSHALAALAQQHAAAPTVVGDMRSLPFRSHRFHGIWASASMLHLKREELAITLTECRRILLPGAPLFASLKLGHGEDRDNRGRRFTYVSPEEWRELLIANRFDVLAIDTDNDSDQGAARMTAPTGWMSSYSRAA